MICTAKAKSERSFKNFFLVLLKPFWSGDKNTGGTLCIFHPRIYLHGSGHEKHFKTHPICGDMIHGHIP